MRIDNESVRPVRRPRPTAIVSLGLAALLLALAGCQSAPSTGGTARVQVLSTPLTRGDLEGRQSYLHAAVRAGVTRADADAGRLVRGHCVEPDPTSPGSVVGFSVTTLLPPGMTFPVPSLVDVQTVRGTAPDAVGARHRQQHGRFVGLGPVLDERNGLRRPSLPDARLEPRCRPEGTPEGLMRIDLSMQVNVHEHDFTVAELARHDQFTDAELAAGRVALVTCQLKVLDGGDWWSPVWLARAPGPLKPVAGDVVMLRAGAQEGSKDRAPIAEVVGPADRPAVPRNARVPCY